MHFSCGLEFGKFLPLSLGNGPGFIPTRSVADSGTVTNATRAASFFSLSRAPARRAIKHFVMQMFRNNNSVPRISHSSRSASRPSNGRLFADELDRVWSEAEEEKKKKKKGENKPVIFCRKMMKYDASSARFTAA